MRTHRVGSHPPDELRRASDLGHRIEGILLLVVAVLAIAGNVFAIVWASTAWPVPVVTAGLLLLIAIYPRHPVGDWSLIWGEPQQRQHTMIAVALVAGGIAVLLKPRLPGLGVVWPGALVLAGILFLTHAQRGTGEAVRKAVRRHRILGATLILAGLIAASAVWTSNAALAELWPVVLLVAALQLLLYREPAGAYEAAHAGHDRGSVPPK